MLKHQPRKKQLASLIHASSHTNRSGILSQLTRTAEQMGDLDQALERALPANLKGKARSNGLSGGLLTITCSSAAHSTMLKMQQGQLIRALRQMNLKVNRIKTQVRPAMTSKPLAKNTRGMTKDTGRLLNEVADTTEDQALKSVMMRLAGHAPK